MAHTEQEARHMLTKSTFSIDGEETVTGYWNEHNTAYWWNGFAQPMATYEQVQALADQLACQPLEDAPRITFTAKTRAFTVYSPASEESDTLEPMMMETEDGTLTLYPIGLSWCWSEDKAEN